MSALFGQALKLAMLAVALLPGLALTAGIEKWVDHEGGVHYADHPPPWADARPVKVQPNVIETGRLARPAATVRRPTSPAQVEPSSDRSHRLRTQMQSYIELCRNNRGIDCEREARAMIDGPATVLFPGDPLIFPRPDLKPPAPPPPPKAPLRLRRSAPPTFQQ